MGNKMNSEKIILPGKEFIKRRRREKMREKISEISFGMMNKLCELVLFSLIFTGELLKPRLGLATSFVRDFSQSLANEYPEIDIKHWIEGFHTIKRNRWIDRNGVLAREGKERLQSLFPRHFPVKHWDGNWYVVNFDIPEEIRVKRSVVREKLRNLGFGMLQQSIWVSPINFLGAVQKEVEEIGLTPFVLCSQTRNLGEEDSKILANRVWKLGELNERYGRFVEKYEKGIPRKDFCRVFLKFISIFQDDSQLPEELLPERWWGNDAYELLQDFYIKGEIRNVFTKSFFGQ